MKAILSFVLIVLCLNASAAQVEITFRPERPVLNQTFEMDVVISGDNVDDPFISFDPGGLIVEGRRKGGVSFTTQLINGQFSSQKTQSFIYQLQANRSGVFYLRDFNIKLGDKNIKKDNLRVTVLREAERPKDYFLEAVPSKEKVYKGEGFFVDYYLYTRVPIYNQELKEYPKLNGFLKRFKNVDETPDRVERGGQIYQRAKKYSARLYAEKTGELTIDSLKIQVGVGFSGGIGGFGLRDLRNVTLASAPVKIEVSDPPIDTITTGFTGLVGEHSFILSVPKNKFLVNEPIELKLEIVGPGLLEKMDNPVIYTNPDLETFDTRSEIQEIDATRSRKVLEYTYLPRSPMAIKERVLELSVFLPESGEYKTTTVKIPPLEVVGGVIPMPKRDTSVAEVVSTSESQSVPKVNYDLNPVSPFGQMIIGNIVVKPVRLFLILSVILLLLSFFSNLKFSSDSRKIQAWIIYKRHLSRGVDYKGLLLFMSNTLPSGVDSIDKDLDSRAIPVDVRDYFKNLLSELRRTTYSSGATPRKIKPKSKMFKKLVKSIQ